MGDSTVVAVASEGDIVTARQAGRALAKEIGFSSTDATLIATAISELARNLIVHAVRGEVQIEMLRKAHRVGLKVIVRDSGPGIADVNQALQDGFSTVGSLGLGLPGARRLSDEFEIDSKVGQGTVVTLIKWLA